jgi:Uma2 family endonuclease
MGTMTSSSTTGGSTRADLDAMPDDGRRYELIDGAILVTPMPVTRHQVIVTELGFLLHQSRSRDVRVLVASVDVALTETRVIVPDILVARRRDFTDTDLPAAPLLVVEVLSPSTRRVDLGRKKDVLAEAGCPSYWVVDPGLGSTPPTLIVHELQDRQYAEVARVSGAESWTATQPFPVTVVPVDLLDD